jgi:hypothetical protein
MLGRVLKKVLEDPGQARPVHGDRREVALQPAGDLDASFFRQLAQSADGLAHHVAHQARPQRVARWLAVLEKRLQRLIKATASSAVPASPTILVVFSS